MIVNTLLLSFSSTLFSHCFIKSPTFSPIFSFSVFCLYFQRGFHASRSPWEPDLVLAGTGDGTLLVWDLSSSPQSIHPQAPPSTTHISSSSSSSSSSSTLPSFSSLSVPQLNPDDDTAPILLNPDWLSWYGNT
jgi:hypothetical protein